MNTPPENPNHPFAWTIIHGEEDADGGGEEEAGKKEGKSLAVDMMGPARGNSPTLMVNPRGSPGWRRILRRGRDRDVLWRGQRRCRPFRLECLPARLLRTTAKGRREATERWRRRCLARDRLIWRQVMCEEEEAIAGERKERSDGQWKRTLGTFFLLWAFNCFTKKGRVLNVFRFSPIWYDPNQIEPLRCPFLLRTNYIPIQNKLQIIWSGQIGYFWHPESVSTVQQQEYVYRLG